MSTFIEVFEVSSEYFQYFTRGSIMYEYEDCGKEKFLEGILQEIKIIDTHTLTLVMGLGHEKDLDTTQEQRIIRINIKESTIANMEHHGICIFDPINKISIVLMPPAEKNKKVG